MRCQFFLDSEFRPSVGPATSGFGGTGAVVPALLAFGAAGLTSTLAPDGDARWQNGTGVV
jgi:hypothetical protein